MKQPLPRQWLGREHLAAGHGHWAVAWCSVGGPHHDTQDVAGLCGREPGPHAGRHVAVADGVTQGAAGSLDPTQPAHMVGCHRLGEPEWRTLQLAPGDMLLLCSDGLHTMLSHASIEQHVAQHLDAAKTFNEVTLQNLCKALVRSAQAAGGEDDITALLLVYRPNACRPFVAA